MTRPRERDLLRCLRAFFLSLVALPATCLLASSAEGPAMDGPTIYKRKCAVCHAADGSGNTAKGKKLKVRPLQSPEARKMSEAQMIELVTKGKGDMDGYKKELSEEEIRAVVAYARELGQKK